MSGITSDARDYGFLPNNALLPSHQAMISLDADVERTVGVASILGSNAHLDRRYADGKGSHHMQRERTI